MRQRCQSPAGVAHAICLPLFRCKRIVLACLLLQSVVCAQGVHPITGRRYAGVMGIGGADWLVRPEREAEEQPDAALDAIGIAKGSVVADVGAGAGYFTWRLAERVGPSGKVYANDIEPRMLELLRSNLQQRKLTNFETVLGAVDDPKLPRNTIDLVLMGDVYHELSNPAEVLAAVRKSLEPHGRIALVEFRLEDDSVPIKVLHRMSKAQIMKEYTANGFKLVDQFDGLPWQHLMFFERDDKK